MKRGFSIIIFIFVLMFSFAFISGNSFAMPEDNVENSFDLELNYDTDSEVLKDDIINFIDLVDNNLIPNTSFNMSSKLNENYDFLTKFAISFILDNSSNYEIVMGDDYIYNNEYGIKYSTNKYVNVNTIYDVTNKVFGVDYYYILNEYLVLNDGMVPLLEIEDYSFDMRINEIININNLDDYIDVIVKYEDIDFDYIYRFDKLNGRLVISNLSIGE